MYSTDTEAGGDVGGVPALVPTGLARGWGLDSGWEDDVPKVILVL